MERDKAVSRIILQWLYYRCNKRSTKYNFNDLVWKKDRIGYHPINLLTCAHSIEIKKIGKDAFPHCLDNELHFKTALWLMFLGI